MKPASFLNAHLGMLLWAVLIAASFFAAAQVSQAVDPLLLTGLRLLLSALMFVPSLWLNGAFRITRAGLRAHALLGLLLAIYFASLFEALRHTSAVNTGILFALVPLLTLLFEGVLLSGDPAKNRLLPMLLAAAGAMLLTFKGGAEGMPSLYAVGVYGVGCLAMAGYSPLSQRLKATSLKDRSPAAMTFWNMLFGALFLFAFCLPGGAWRSAVLLTLDDGLWLLYLALFATLATFWLLHRAIGVIAPATVISYIYLSTLFITLFHWFGLGRQPLPSELLGALLVGLGMFALILGSRRPAPALG
ncbi:MULTISPECIES: DMT family transporter [Pseudomonas]|uniref:DMT family transporter n=1 Tax=Pseudomonas TaxID=286 RepID=UPI0005AA9884|nr:MULTISPECIES: DMT family transporter [Pseudomonas]AZD90934.1 putative membrane protein [Pseudomonas chlororaphis subsp. aureofaciens]AZD97398.1 putative membrane protein [Pseudomonas chlororaphis subsp. aureofaciens]AZE03640.1 putative membrane protein [Pseudomonas chlororaphis subsp. aureofaciens]AZE09780.1 putative membrane protein [Pseudomonas chlororaphis subsp. aureofaciens]KAA5846616.1 DMT family transporter [Pseudomonas chlororaphis]